MANKAFSFEQARLSVEAVVDEHALVAADLAADPQFQELSYPAEQMWDRVFDTVRTIAAEHRGMGIPEQRGAQMRTVEGRAAANRQPLLEQTRRAG